MAVASTTLDVVRAIGQGVVLQLPSNTIDTTRFDYAFRMAGREFVRRTRCTRTANTALAMTVDNAEVDYSSITDTEEFDPTRFIRGELVYPGGSAWADATAYTVNTLVTNGGKLYVARVAHTSADGTDQPGVDSGWEDKWSLVYTDVAYQLRRRNYFAVQRAIASFQDANQGYDYDRTIRMATDSRYVSFRGVDTKMVFNFVPDTAWKLRIVYWSPLTEWTIGTGTPSSVTLNIPDDMIEGVVHYGVPLFYERGEELQPRLRQLRASFDAHIRDCSGQVGDDVSVTADETAYL